MALPANRLTYQVINSEDGTYKVLGLVDGVDVKGDPEPFPTEQEAQWFADARTEGASVAGGYQSVHFQRLSAARAAFKAGAEQ